MKESTIKSAFKKIRKSLYWTTASGDEMVISDMEKSHLQNTIIYISKKQEECTKYKLGNFEINDMIAKDWIEVLKEELKLRK